MPAWLRCVLGLVVGLPCGFALSFPLETGMQWIMLQRGWPGLESGGVATPTTILNGRTAVRRICRDACDELRP